jgi:sugar transferase EpsL
MCLKIENNKGQAGIWFEVIKRAIDLIVASLLLLLLTPALLVVGLLIYLQMGSPVMFRQLRPGRNAKPFTVMKFRTMSNERNSRGELLPDIERVTRLGRLLRCTSLDELPQLWNVLKGEMSLVGPRPLLLEYVRLYSDEQRRRMTVKPGITGLAQVNGRNNISWENKLKLDVEYVDKRSLKNDLKIIIFTIKYVMLANSVDVTGVDNIQKFNGPESESSAKVKIDQTKVEQTS